MGLGKLDYGQDAVSKHVDNIQDWATLGGGEGDPAGSSPQIEQAMIDYLSQYVNVYWNESDLPGTASTRGDRGTFFDPDDVLKYLDYGLLKLEDENGNPIKNDLVHCLLWRDPFTDELEIEVYIDDTTP